MEQMVQQADFMHTDNEELKDKFKPVSAWRSTAFTFAELQACFMAAQSKICRPDFPSKGTSGYHMGFCLVGALNRIASDLVGEGKAAAADICEMYLEFILSMVQSGPKSSHIEYIRMLMTDSKVQFNNFFQSLHGDRLRSIVLAVKRDFQPDADMDTQTFFSSHFYRFFTVFMSGFSTEQFQETQVEFLDIYMFFRTGFLDCDEDRRKAMLSVGFTINRSYKRKIFADLKDPSLLRQHLRTLMGKMLTPQFPQSEEVAKEIKSDLADMLNTVSEEGMVSQLYGDIMDMALALTVSKAGCKDTLPHFDQIGYFFNHLKEEMVKDNKELFEGLMSKYLHFLSHVGDEVYLSVKFVMPISYECLNKAMGKSDHHIRLWLDMIKALLKHSIPLCVETARRAMREKDKLLKWKKRAEDLKEIFALLSNITFPKWLTENQLKEGNDYLKDLAETVLDEAKKVGIVKLGLTEPLMRFTFHCLEGGTKTSYILAYRLASRLEFDPKRDKALMMEVIQRVTTYLEDDSYDWEEQQYSHLSFTLRECIKCCFDDVKDGRTFTMEEYNELIYLVKLCEKKMGMVSDPGNSFFYIIFINICFKISTWLQTMNEEHRLIPMVPSLINMLDSDDASVFSIATNVMLILSRTAGAMFARYNQKLVDKFLEDENESLLCILVYCYEHNKAPVEKHFDELFEHIKSGNVSVRTNILQLLGKVAKLQPHLFTEEKVGVVVKKAKEDGTQQVLLLMLLSDVAKRHIECLEPWVDDFMMADLWQPISAHSRLTILQLYGIGSEEKADRVISYLMKRIKMSEDNMEVLLSLNACRLIGFKHRPAIEKHRGTIEQFKNSTSNTDYHTSSMAILDMLDGKSMDKINEELRELHGEVADLDLRVTVVENDIGEVKDVVREQGVEVNNVRKEIGQQGQQMSHLQDTVNDTVAKLQEIDGKTLSHAPFWARDVSRLLNKEAEADWRLLGLHLGFTNDDLRAWATTSDPCMSMLNEWYATHKTREATHAVLTSLQLLDHVDAASIVENAMKNAEAVVETEEFEYPSPPEVFVSYQWGHQDHVKLLCQHLNKAGFSCWMDVGQMGGGDKLFEKIDTGIRGAKVVISCVTAKYARSPNCIREVNLSVSLNKPIIPLLLEQTLWPPPGSLGPLFSELLFIRFFQRSPGEQTSDQRYWPLPKFQELLMQLSFHGLIPDKKGMHPDYKDWWVPKVEEITIDKDRTNKNAVSSPLPSGHDKSPTKAPEVFISYQWGKQPQILKLYARLTSLGYRCWLDVMQMGGGDSLYDKIDSGLRGCRLVLACVTTKYAKSPNCRREVSLADALQKPLIPVLLEKLEWPPPGPMSPILTQLLYLDCTASSLQDSWLGPQFDQLLARINCHATPTCPQGDREKEEKGKEVVGKKEGAGEQREGKGNGEMGKGVEEKGSDMGVGKKEVKPASLTAEQPTTVPVAVATESPSFNINALNMSGEEEERKQGERSRSSEETAPSEATPQEKDDNKRQDSNGDQDHAKPDPHPRKTSNTSSVDSLFGHSGYDFGHQRSRPIARAAAMPKSACCIVL